MRNIFILYIPPSNYEAKVHYEDTIVKKVEAKSIYNYVDQKTLYALKNIFNNKPIAVWGSRDSEVNRSKYEKMRPGDDILIIEGEKIKLLGKIAAKTINPELSSALWKNIKKGGTVDGWNLIYFIANPLQIELNFSEFKKLFKYEENWSLRGFTNISDSKLSEFYNKYDDLYSILIRLKNGQKVEEKKEKLVEKDYIEEVHDTLEEFVPEDSVVSEHLRIQWKLVNLGLKTGSKIWIPKNDQGKISKEYRFDEFEKEFTAGLDTPAKYVENIDVVWKEEFRIDAAFEIENTTSIYSGLLRFSDLKIVAPNSNYPLFIVAPLAKKNRLIEQLHRPTFKKLEFNKKVRYLPYESIDSIDKFFENSTTGLNIDVLVGKSEQVA